MERNFMGQSHFSNYKLISLTFDLKYNYLNDFQISIIDLQMIIN